MVKKSSWWDEIRCVSAYDDNNKRQITKSKDVISLFVEELESPSVTDVEKIEHRRVTVGGNLIQAQELLGNLKRHLKIHKNKIINLLGQYRCKGCIRLETPTDIRALWKCTNWDKDKKFRYSICSQKLQAGIADAIMDSHQRWFGIQIKEGYLYELKDGKVRFSKDETATKYGFQVPDPKDKRALNKAYPTQYNMAPQPRMD